MRLEEIHNKIVQYIRMIAYAVAAILGLYILLSSKNLWAFHPPEMDMCIIEMLMEEKHEQEREDDRHNHEKERNEYLTAIEKAEKRNQELRDWRNGQDDRDRELFSGGTYDSRDDRSGAR